MRLVLHVLALGLVLGAVEEARAQGRQPTYPKMASIEQYLIADREAEIAMARSAAPEAISRDAKILVLGRHGYETAVEGKNGFVCMVERGWMGAFDWPEFWSPKTRGPDCLNPSAARSILPLALLRTEMVLAGRSKAEIIEAIKAGFEKRQFPALEPGAMSYMMSKTAYLTDEGDHNGPHLMFFVPVSDSATWGANQPNSPVGAGPYWYISEKAYPQLKGIPPMLIFTVHVATWSDGTAAPM